MVFVVTCRVSVLFNGLFISLIKQEIDLEGNVSKVFPMCYHVSNTRETTLIIVCILTCISDLWLVFKSIIDCCLMPSEHFLGQYHEEQVKFEWNDVDDITFLLHQHTLLNVYSASSLQRSEGSHVTPLEHVILISSQAVFALTPKCCLFSREATNTNFVVLNLNNIYFENNQTIQYIKHSNYIQDSETSNYAS